MEDFTKKLEVANQYENWIAKYLCKENNFTFISFNNDNKFDFAVYDKNGQDILFEVKHDYQTHTGNIAIEYNCRNKPSCINTTQSDFYVFIFPLLNEVWIIKTNKLKKLIEDFQKGLHEDNWTSNLYYRDNAEAGDCFPNSLQKVSKVHLMRRNDIRNYFRVIKFNNIPKY